MLAIISLKLGFFDQARRHMEAARQLIQPSDRRERFLVIRAWGAGFWADVLHTIHGLALAEASGRTPIVHWGLECRYRRAGIENAWPLYFEPVSPHTIATAERALLRSSEGFCRALQSTQLVRTCLEGQGRLKVCPCSPWRACHHWVSSAGLTASDGRNLLRCSRSACTG